MYTSPPLRNSGNRECPIFETVVFLHHCGRLPQFARNYREALVGNEDGRRFLRTYEFATDSYCSRIKEANPQPFSRIIVNDEGAEISTLFYMGMNILKCLEIIVVNVSDHVIRSVEDARVYQNTISRFLHRKKCALAHADQWHVITCAQDNTVAAYGNNGCIFGQYDRRPPYTFGSEPERPDAEHRRRRISRVPSRITTSARCWIVCWHQQSTPHGFFWQNGWCVEIDDTANNSHDHCCRKYLSLRKAAVKKEKRNNSADGCY